MNTEKWFNDNTESLKGKTIAMTGCTGGIGRCLCEYFCRLGADLIMLDRNRNKAERLKSELNMEFKDTAILSLSVDLQDELSVISVCSKLEKYKIDVFIHNAGAYSIPRGKTRLGLDNVFTINFASPYYIINRILPIVRKSHGKIIAVGSIAHNYSKSDIEDIDFSSRKAASKVYGNAKRYLMFSLYELFKNETDASLAVAHPGITFTGITAHYPKLIFTVIKHPMKVIFMKPKKAALSIIRAVFEDCGYSEWIGPRLFDVWGYPRLKTLNTCSSDESLRIFESANEVLKQYKKLEKF